jgi:type I site-specific restriction-modification system R (restriction) subunit
MTATPLREETRDTYLYFGDPIYQYSLRQGIDDGFLAPYRVHRVVTEWDAAGWRPSKDELDRYGRSIPDDEYHTKDFERLVALRARTEAIARHLTQFLQKTDRFAKTIVFCVDQEHASEMRTALSNLNGDLAAQHSDEVANAETGGGKRSAFALPNLICATCRMFQSRFPLVKSRAASFKYLESLQARTDRMKLLQTQTAAELDALYETPLTSCGDCSHLQKLVHNVVPHLSLWWRSLEAFALAEYEMTVAGGEHVDISVPGRSSVLHTR